MLTLDAACAEAYPVIDVVPLSDDGAHLIYLQVGMSPSSTLGAVQSSDYIATASGILSLIAIVVSVIVARSQMAVARREQLLPFIREVLDEFHEPEFKTLLGYVTGDLATDCPQPPDGYRPLDEATRQKLRPLTSYFNEVGVLVANNVVSAELVSGLMGGSIVESWDALAPYIYARRHDRGDDPNYYAYYEHLAACMQKLGPDRLEAKLGLKRLPPA